MSHGATWIDRAGDLEGVVASMGAGPVAVDTEADSFHHYREKVCLIQLAFGATTVLVDPLSGLDPGPLAPILADRSVRKVLHGADYDLRLLHRDFGFSLKGLFDTMIAARLVGERPFGLAALLESRLGVRLDKSHQLADWSARPLPDDLVRYASDDTRHLVELSRGLEDDLRRLGRESWAQEEFERLESVRWPQEEKPDADAFRRVKGSGRLEPRQLAVLREIWLWRDDRARQRDVPPFRIVGDAVLLALATRPTDDPVEIASIRGAPRSWSRGRVPAEVARRIRHALALPEEAWPVRNAGRPRRPSPALKQRVAELRRVRDTLAGELGLEPSLLATRTQIEEIAACVESGRPLRGSVSDLRRWQAELLTPLIDAS